MSPTRAEPSRPSPIVVLAGPTGVGKTYAAIELARRLDGELVGADSVQVYRGFDIGASKPTALELLGIEHHLIDIREPEAVLDAASYAGLADEAIAAIRARGKLPIVVGGTGLWLRALLRGLVAVPPADPQLRAQLEAEWDHLGAVAMHVRLAQVDPLSAARIHPNDKKRVVRALEVYAQSGQALGEAQARHALGQPRYRDLSFVLDLPPVMHRERVRARTQAMLQAGFKAEVEGLLAKHGSAVRPLRSVGYAQMVAHITGAVTLADTELGIVRATLLYARRQRTWFRSDPAAPARVTMQNLLAADTLQAIEALASRQP